MKESMWMYIFMIIGIIGLFLVNFFSNITVSNEQNYYLLKEITEAAMIDAVDLEAYRSGVGYDDVNQITDPSSMHCISGIPGTVRILKEKFVESFVRRFAENAEISKTYTIRFDDIDECPPRVTVTLIAHQTYDFFSFFEINFESDNVEITNTLSAILEYKVKSHNTINE